MSSLHDVPAGPPDLDALITRTDAADSGPWTAEAGEEAWSVTTSEGSLSWDDHSGEVFTQANADFIAHAREDIPALLAALAAERARADQAEQRAAAVLRSAAVVAYKGPDDTDTALLRTAARNLDRGLPLGGGNLTRTVVNVLCAVAAVLDDANA